MATAAELRTRIKRRLSRAGLTTYDTVIFDELVHVQQEILEKSAELPNFLKTKQTFTKTGAHSSIDISTQTELARFLRPLSRDDVASLEYLDASGVYQKLPRFDSWDVLYQRYPGTAQYPIGYFWDGNVAGLLELQPTPTATVAYRARFYRADLNTANSLDANGGTLWTKHAGDYLMHTTGIEVAEYLRDTQALDYFSQKRQEAYTRFIKQCVAQDMADEDLVMGDD